MNVDSELTSIKGIGPRRAQALQGAGLFTLRDLVYFAPRDYLDFSHPTPVSSLRQGEDALVEVALEGDARYARARKGLTIVTARAKSGEESINLVWYNQPYRAQSVKADRFPGRAFAGGRADLRRGTKLVNPTLYSAPPGIVGVYPSVKAVPQRVLRAAILVAMQALEGLSDPLPDKLREARALMPLHEAIRQLHFPTSFEALRRAKRRLAFEDMLMLSLMIALIRRERVTEAGRSFEMGGIRAEFLQKLPFVPTGAQLRAIGDIERDMASRLRMNRLIQGDVGSGKTAIALFAMYAASENGCQAALMAPTEILAAQHFRTLSALFGDDVALLTGGMKKRERDAAAEAVRCGRARMVVGTHALLSGGTEFFNLGLVIADEQHRFGVRQRAAIGAKGEAPDMLIMSATPIPRTLSLMLYGDLDVSVVDELPPGRKPILTRRVPVVKRDDMYRFIEAEIRKGRQAYVVCPLVEQSEALLGVMGASELYEELAKSLNARVALLHGQMRADEKQRASAAFIRGEIDVLVATTVVEVGVDVPNATIMAVENADRFGLAQLHQLRGRVGRGGAQSYCFLISNAAADAASERLDILTRTQDGFEVAERDLLLRGPGELLGSRQHGAGEFDLTRFAESMDVLTDAKACADALFERPLDADARPLIDAARALLGGRLGRISLN